MASLWVFFGFSPVRASGAGKLMLQFLFFSSFASCFPACFPFLLFRSAILPAGGGGGGGRRISLCGPGGVLLAPIGSLFLTLQALQMACLRSG